MLDSDENEITLEDTLANAHIQIDEKQYEAELISEGFMPQQIRKYGFAFQEKNVWLGSARLFATKPASQRQQTSRPPHDTHR